MKSTVPANFVFSPSVAKRLMFLMPDWPAVRLFQAFAAPVTHRRHDRLRQRAVHRVLARGPRRKQATTADGERGEGDVHGKLRLQGKAEIGAGGADGNVAVLREEGALLGGRGRRARGAGDHRGLAGLEMACNLAPELAERRGHVAGVFPARPVGMHGAETGEALGAARLRMLAGLDHQKRAERAERKAGARLAVPHRYELVLQAEAAELVKHQQVGALGVVTAADQRDVALARCDPRMRDPDRVDARGLFAHEGARRPGHPVHDRDVAGEQVRKLREEQRRAKIAHQPFVEKGLRLLRGRQAGQDRRVGGDIALAAARRNDHVGAREDLCVALDARGVERKARRIGADALPRLHLPLIALLRDLLVEVDRRDLVNDVGRVAGAVGLRLPRAQPLPMRVRPLAKAGDDAEAGDEGLAVVRSVSQRASHGAPSPAGTRCVWRRQACCRGTRPSGNQQCGR
jgi:hypothetical protein